jgi:hypothetical protein
MIRLWGEYNILNERGIAEHIGLAKYGIAKLFFAIYVAYPQALYQYTLFAGNGTDILAVKLGGIDVSTAQTFAMLCQFLLP